MDIQKKLVCDSCSLVINIPTKGTDVIESGRSNPSIIKLQKSISKNEKTYRDGIPKK